MTQAPGSPEAPPTFDDVWELAQDIPGWLKVGQGRLLWEETRALAGSPVVLEIGSHQGRSTVLLAASARAKGGQVIAVDPFVEGRLFGGQSTREKFEHNLASAGLRDSVRLVADYSTALRPTWNEPFDLLYIDGKHDYWTVVDDLGWTVHLEPGALTLIHDSFCSVGVTSALLDHVLVRGRLRYLRRETTMAVFDSTTPSSQDRRRLAAELPWFTRNVTIKAARRVHATPVLRALGHDSPHDPY